MVFSEGTSLIQNGGPAVSKKGSLEGRAWRFTRLRRRHRRPGFARQTYGGQRLGGPISLTGVDINGRMDPQKEFALKTAFVYRDRYFKYDYGWSHPLKIERLKLTFDLCKAYELFDLNHTSQRSCSRQWEARRLPAVHEGSGGISGKKCFSDSCEV